MEGVIFAIVFVIYLIGWIYRLITSATAAIRKSFGAPVAAPPAAPTLGTPAVSTSAPTLPARPDLRRPDLWRIPAVNTQAVPREATTQEFRQETQELFASEPSALNEPLLSLSGQTAPPSALVTDSRDLMRAFIWQEVLAPPLSRRR